MHKCIKTTRKSSKLLNSQSKYLGRYTKASFPPLRRFFFPSEKEKERGKEEKPPSFQLQLHQTIHPTNRSSKKKTTNPMSTPAKTGTKTSSSYSIWLIITPIILLLAATIMSHLPRANNPVKKTISPRRSTSRGHTDLGWLSSHHTLSITPYDDPRFRRFGALRVLNEDRVAARQGFPTHAHRDFEIFSYVLSGELTHRDSTVKAGEEEEEEEEVSGGGDNNKKKKRDDFSRLRRGDVQFTTGGTGIAHSEQNEHGSAEVHFLQIWALPWKMGLPPVYHTATFGEEAKRERFVTVISPLKAGKGASGREEREAVPVVEGTIPIHADFLMGAGIIGVGGSASWRVGVGGGGEGEKGAVVVEEEKGRKIYLHLPMRRVGARIRVEGETVLEEGDGAFVDGWNAGDELRIESIGEGEAEVVVLDSN